MKQIRLLYLISLLLILHSTQAGVTTTPQEPKSDSVELVDDSAIVLGESDSSLTAVLPGWLAGIDGTFGVNGIDSHVDVGFDDIAKNLDMIGALGLEGKYGKFGFILEGIYLKMSVGAETPGSLLSDPAISVEQVLAEATLTYRIFENDRAWLELLAGARYVYMGTELSFSANSAGVQTASENISAELFDRAEEAAREEINKRLPSLIASIEDKAAELKQNAITQIQGRVHAKIDPIRQEIRDRVDAGVGSSRPGLGAGIANRRPIRNAIRDYVNAKVAAEIEAARAKASAAVATARARVRSKVEKRLEKAEARLAQTIEKEITDRINDANIAASKSWVDPFVGFRGRCQLTERSYLTARGDIGGFGVGSELTWNAYAALGFDFTERASMEIGYRYLDIDYQSGAFSMAAAMHGPYVGLRYEF